jgi:signal transduction histidine kinase
LAANLLADLFGRLHLPRSLTARILVAAGVWMSVVLVAGGVMLSLLYRETVESNFDARLSILLDSLVGISTMTPDGGITLSRIMADPRFDEPYSGWYWQISEKGRQPFRSRSLWDLDLHSGNEGNLTEPHFYDGLGPEDQQLRVIERDILLPESDRTFRFMVAADRSEIGEALTQFNRTLLIWLASLGAGLVAAMIIQVRYGLQPLRRLRTSLTEIRSGRKSRLEENFPNEVMPLVSELNALLEHNEAVVERAKTHVGNLAHALKTPLTVLSNEAALAPDSLLSQTVLKQTSAMSRQVNHHLARARAAARGNVIGSRAPLTPAIADLRRALERIYADRHLQFRIEGVLESGNEAFRGERQDLDEMLGNLMDNACKWTRTQVLVSVSFDNDWIRVAVEDDGPGIALESREQVFGRGERADLSVPGTGLGLAIVRDIAELCGGRIELSDSALGGLKALLTLPKADCK